MENTINLSLVGHSPKDLAGYDLDIPFYRHLQDKLVQYIKQAGLTHDVVRCHTNMSLGANTIWALAILEVKQDTTIGATIELIVHIPYLSQPDTWYDKKDKERWLYIKEHANETIINDDLSHYSTNQHKQRMHHAIQYTTQEIVDVCDILLVVYNGDTNSDISHILECTNKPIFQIRVDIDIDIDMYD